MDLKSAYVTFALGLAVGIVTALALANPFLAGGLLVACLLVLAASAVVEVRKKRRQRRAESAFEAQSEAGQALRQRLIREQESLAYWRPLIEAWDKQSQETIREYAAEWCQKYKAWPVPATTFVEIAGPRGQMVRFMAGQLEALAEIRTKL
jgi:hypothetical protein